MRSKFCLGPLQKRPDSDSVFKKVFDPAAPDPNTAHTTQVKEV